MEKIKEQIITLDAQIKQINETILQMSTIIKELDEKTEISRKLIHDQQQQIKQQKRENNSNRLKRSRLEKKLKCLEEQRKFQNEACANCGSRLSFKHSIEMDQNTFPICNMCIQDPLWRKEYARKPSFLKLLEANLHRRCKKHGSL